MKYGLDDDITGPLSFLFLAALCAILVPLEILWWIIGVNVEEW